MKKYGFPIVALLLTLSMVFPLIAVADTLDLLTNGQTHLGVFHAHNQYPPPAGETMTVRPEPDNPDFTLNIPSPVKESDAYPENPDRLAFVLTTEGISYWIPMPDDLTDWTDLDRKAIRFSIDNASTGNDLFVSTLLSFEVIGESLNGRITAWDGNTLQIDYDNATIDALYENAPVFTLTDSVELYNKPQVGDDCLFLIDMEGNIQSITKGQG